MAIFTPLVVKGLIGTAAVAIPVTIWAALGNTQVLSSQEDNSNNTKKKELETVDNLLLEEIDKFESWSENKGEIKIKRNGENNEISLEIKTKQDKENFIHQLSFSFEEDDSIDNYEEWICSIQWKNKIEENDIKRELLGISKDSVIDKEKMKKTVKICSERREDDSDDHKSVQIYRNIKISSTLIPEGESDDDKWFNNFLKSKTTTKDS